MIRSNTVSPTKVRHHVQNTLSLVPILSQFSPVHAIPPDFKINFNNIPRSMSKSSKWSLSSRFHIETLYETLLDTCYMPRQYHWMCKQVPQQTPAPTPKKKSTERKGKERKGKERKGKERKSADTVGFIIDTCKDSPVAASCQSHIIPRC